MEKKKIYFKSSFSKAKFELIKTRNKLFLKKKIPNPNFRDYQSILKNNKMINELKIKSLKIPYIKLKNFKQFYKTKSFSSIYLEGYSGDLILLNIGFKEIEFIKNFLFNYFNLLQKKIVWVKIDKFIFLKKLDDLKKKIKIKELEKCFNKKIFFMKKEIKEITYYPTGVCHGDLTLSNMILHKKNLFLIDFLQTYNDGILQDLSKIYQEFVLGWSSRNLSIHQKLRSKIISKKIIDKNFFKPFSNKILKHFHFEIMMTLFRIFPYVKKDDLLTIKWLINSVDNVYSLKKKNKFLIN